MKSGKVLAVAALLLVGSVLTGVQAQEHLKALVKKCESLDKVDMDVIYDKNRETKKTEKVIKSLSFTDAQLMNEFLAAFEKDKEAAYKVIETKKKGKIQPSYYCFFSGTTDTAYSFDVRDSGKVSVSVIEKYNQDPKKSTRSLGTDWGG